MSLSASILLDCFHFLSVNTASDGRSPRVVYRVDLVDGTLHCYQMQGARPLTAYLTHFTSWRLMHFPETLEQKAVTESSTASLHCISTNYTIDNRP